jgi:uncharacterized protein (DUF433 family)
MFHFEDYIEIRAEKRFGRPVLKGTRISVYDILNWLANGMSTQDIINDFPELNSNHIRACLVYAASRENNLRIAK